MQPDEIFLGEGMTRTGPADARKLGDITADAFRHDPFNHWLFGNFAGIESLFHLQARTIYAPHGYCYTLGDQGACMWMLPGGNPSFGLSWYLQFALSTLLKCGPRSVMHGVRTGEAMERRHPQFDHAYLFSIGLRQTEQGKGLGRRLIQPVLDACDRRGLPAYLENSNPANTGFYASCGFEELGEPIFPESGSPPLVPMVRQPRRA